MTKPRVLVIDEEVPVPTNTGKRIRTLNLLSQLTSEFEITLLVHRNGASPEAVTELERRGIQTLVAKSSIPPKTGVGFPLKVLSNLLFSKLPYSVASHHQREYQDQLNRLAAEGGFDMVHCEWTPYSLYLRGVKLPVVISAHNVEAEIWHRLAAGGSGLRGHIYGTQAVRMKAFEAWAFSNASHVTAVSDGDAATIRGLGAGHVEVVANGVDLDYFSPQPAQEAEENILVFTGSMDWHPNQDAIRWFIDEVHPNLSKQTSYRLVVVGRNPPPWMTDPSQLPETVSVTGTVEDVRPYIAKARVYVTPLRAGGGSRLKILEAFSMMKAVVSTSVGAEGLHVRENEHLLLANTAQSFADRVAALLEDPAQRQQLGRRGRRLVEDQYSWSSIARTQAAVWHKAIAGGS